MDGCGNIFHDLPQYLLLALPFLASLALWVRAKLPKPSKDGCECGHDHAGGERHS